MTVEEMKNKKRELGYTNEMISEKSGVPLGTVQKIFSGETSSPRYNTLVKLEKVLNVVNYEYKFDECVNLAEGVSLALDNNIMEKGRNNRKNKGHEYFAFSVEKRIGVAAGKFKVPDDCFFYDDEITEMFEEI